MIKIVNNNKNMALNNVNYKYFPLNEELKKYCHPEFYHDCLFVEDCVSTEGYKKYADEILDFQIRDDDIFVCSFPKCGTTWTQEMVWCIGNDLDFDTAKKEDIGNRFPFLELSLIMPLLNKGSNGLFSSKQQMPECYTNSLELTKNVKGQRFVKTHLPLQLLPKQLRTIHRKAKMVYIARDPRDACISYYHHYKRVDGYTGDLSTFANLYLKDGVLYAPFWQHVLGYWNIRHEPNVLFITYEEMTRDLPAVIERVATFLDKTLSPDQVAALADHLSFDSMKNNPAVNYEGSANILQEIMGSSGKFMRSGESGVFMNDLTAEEIERFNVWCEKNIRGTDYTLPDHHTPKHKNQ